MKGEDYVDNRYTLEPPVLIGLSQRYYLRFFLSIPIVLLIFMVMSFIMNRPTTALIICGSIQAIIYIYFLIRRKRYGDKPNEISAYRKQDREVIFDDAEIFEKQET